MLVLSPCRRKLHFYEVGGGAVKVERGDSFTLKYEYRYSLVQVNVGHKHEIGNTVIDQFFFHTLGYRIARIGRPYDQLSGKLIYLSSQISLFCCIWLFSLSDMTIERKAEQKQFEWCDLPMEEYLMLGIYRVTK